MISFDAQMRAIHDHLYASANIRVPEDLQLEVAKVVQTRTWLAVVNGNTELDGESRARILAGDRAASAPVAKDLRRSFTAYNQAVRRYTRDQAVLRLDDASLAYIVASLDGIDMSDASRDWLGDALEVFRSTAAKRLGGQFFTDQQVTSLAIKILEYDASVDDLLDICAGTGGFLIAGARAAQLQGVTEAPTIRGIEVDSSLAHLANSTLHHLANFETENVFNADSFREPNQWPLALRKTVVAGTHKCLASNPPFGQKITVKDQATLRRFELGHVWSKTAKGWTMNDRVSATPPDILFIEKNLELADPDDGRVALILPYQALSGPKLGYVRDWILRHAKIRAVVDLPDDTFQPWTGTKTSLVVLEKRRQPLRKWDDSEDYPIFMAISREIGHDRRGNPKIGSDGRIVCDIPNIGSEWLSYRAGDTPTNALQNSFVISAKEITNENDLRLNASFYEPSESTLLLEAKGGESDDFTFPTVGSVTKRIFFPGRFKRNYVESGTPGRVPFLGGTNVTQIIPTNRKFIAADDPKLEELRVESGWILVTRSGSTGIVSTVPEPWHGYAMSEHVIRIIPDENKLPAAYLEAYLRSSTGQELLAQGIFGSVIDEITPEHISSMPIPVPKDENTLRRIADAQASATALREQSIAAFNLAYQRFEESVTRKFVRVREDADFGLPDQNVIDQCKELIEGEVALESVRSSKHQEGI